MAYSRLKCRPKGAEQAIKVNFGYFLHGQRALQRQYGIVGYFQPSEGIGIKGLRIGNGVAGKRIYFSILNSKTR